VNWCRQNPKLSLRVSSVRSPSGVRCCHWTVKRRTSTRKNATKATQGGARPPGAPGNTLHCVRTLTGDAASAGAIGDSPAYSGKITAQEVASPPPQEVAACLLAPSSQMSVTDLCWIQTSMSRNSPWPRNRSREPQPPGRSKQSLGRHHSSVCTFLCKVVKRPRYATSWEQDSTANARPKRERLVAGYSRLDEPRP
jgi:hypothetical protein